MANYWSAMSQAFQNVDWYNVGNQLGSTAMNVLDPFDFSGRRAAQTQFENQLYLDNSARDYNSLEARKQRTWEEYMSNTQYQRAVEDLKRAGLNPWLALQNSGFSGSVPSGSSASSSSGSAGQANNKLYVAAGLIATALKMFLKK